MVQNEHMNGGMKRNVGCELAREIPQMFSLHEDASKVGKERKQSKKYNTGYNACNLQIIKEYLTQNQVRFYYITLHHLPLVIEMVFPELHHFLIQAYCIARMHQNNIMLHP